MAIYFKCPHCGNCSVDEIGETAIDYDNGLFKCVECGNLLSVEEDSISYDEYLKIWKQQESKNMTREEAIKIVKEFINGTCLHLVDQEALKTLIPELAESEDERVEKLITDSVFYQYGAGVEYKDVLDYLDRHNSEKVGKGTTICGQDYKCKKDYKEGNCWYIKDVIYHCSRDGYLTDQNGVSWSCTPEWFKEYIQTNAEWAEEEKTRFVSGQFLQCKLSFDGFKEGEHYWLEYVGDDMYVGRSDNILSQKFYITPRQLYTLFSQQLEEVQGPSQEEKQVSLNYEPPFNENPSDKEIIEALIKHLKEQDGFLTAIDSVSTKAILSWLEKQKEQESESCEPDTNVEKVIEDVIRVYGKTQGEWVGGYDVDTLIVNLRRAFNKKEQKPAEVCGVKINGEPVPIENQSSQEWSGEDEEYLQAVIALVSENALTMSGGARLVKWLKDKISVNYQQTDGFDKEWTIEDAKKGDILANQNCVLIFDHLGEFEGKPVIESWFYADTKQFYGEGTTVADKWCVDGFRPATPLEIKYLKDKMKEKGLIIV